MEALAEESSKHINRCPLHKLTYTYNQTRRDPAADVQLHSKRKAGPCYTFLEAL